ncbi:hypothetical protein [Plantibacter sp. LMC-P-059a]|jgi:hypothetical protein|uniref:hypothetical protein n=1 Tax=Plantibacter sp. LMC-P-059a TaxID=3040297 RepID=UPI00254CC29A|nr:hypothetical protein [Plantibacter sp. LMC-P-059a]
MTDGGTWADRRRARHDGARRGFDRSQRRGLEPGDVETVAKYLKERVYATFTGLAIVLVLAANVEHHDAADALFSLVIGVVGITLAGLVAEMIAHLTAHGAFPDQAGWRTMLRIAWGSLLTVATPTILLVLAVVGVMEVATSLRVSAIVYLITLGLSGWFAVRRARLTIWQQLIALAALVLLGVLVIGVQVLAHG